ncbi:MAG TPA: hypothetical protein VN363_09355 [Anaerolineales bacterium]|nr:hypothetical protein [Anaerolineales bacterium]
MTDHPDHAQFLPFHAINEFMRPDFRLGVVRSALQSVESALPEKRSRLDQLTRKLVTVPGFRNSAKAPLALRARPAAEAFEKSAPLAAAIISAWAAARPELASRTHQLLSERGWEILPLEADRAKLPGFMIHWPKGDDFETLLAAYKTANPEDDTVDDEISLMVVWVGNRLPYDQDDDAGEAE